MTLRIPKVVLVVTLLGLTAVASVVATLILTGNDREIPPAAATAPVAAAASSPQIAKPSVAPRPQRKMLVRLTVREMPAQTSLQSVTIRGRTTRGATVTVRDKRAIVRRGIYSVRLKLRLGTNRFTVVSRHASWRTRRRPMKLNRLQPALAQAAPSTSGDPCAPGHGHGDYNAPGSYIEPSLGYCVPPNGIEPEG